MSWNTMPSRTQTSLAFLGSMLFLIWAVACSGDESLPVSTSLASTGTPGAEEVVGERLFLETRFAQAFKASLDKGSDINDPNIGDPVVDIVETIGAPIEPGPFKGLSMNCRACHLVDDVLNAPGGGMQTYTDFARRSPLPARADGKTVAVRNSPPLVNSAIHRPGGVLFHFHAEFNSMEELVAATFTGRNFGWLPGERTQAIAHIARVGRSDDGTGIPIRTLLGGTDAPTPEEFRLTSEFPLDYSRHLLQLINTRESAGTLQVVASNPNRADGRFQFHTQPFSFGEQELAGLKMFLSEPAAQPASPAELAAGQIGNCIACHAAPNFTDFKAHNTGTTQNEYDAIPGHGNGAFMNLAIAALAARTADDLPATEQHPTAGERFRAVPAAGTTFTDLGLWNVFANPDMPEPQEKIRNILCEDEQSYFVSHSNLLNRAIARFRTPGLRDLGHSAPFMHNSQFDMLDNVISFYKGASDQPRAGTLRNGAYKLQGIALTDRDVAPLGAFLNSLNEDYQ
jgi:hypothetical protein